MDEKYKFALEMSELQGKFITDAIRLADEYGVDRNKTMEMAAFSFFTTLTGADFSEYNTDSENLESDKKEGKGVWEL